MTKEILDGLTGAGLGLAATIVGWGIAFLIAQRTLTPKPFSKPPHA